MKTKEEYESEILDIVETEDWDRAKASNDRNLYQYVKRRRNTDENCKIIWEHIKTEIRDLESEILEIIETKSWDRAKASNDRNLYNYICRHKSTDENCRIIWEHIKTKIRETRDFKSEIIEIIEIKDWDRARSSNDKNLYFYICHHKDTDKNCRIIWEHINQRTRDFKSEILEIVKTKDWDRARYYNDKNLYNYVYQHKDTDKNCRTVWEHIAAIERHCPYTIKDYLLDYFNYGKLENESLRNWFTREIRKGNQSCIDVKNLIVAAENYQDPVALETLSLIKNHLEKEGT